MFDGRFVWVADADESAITKIDPESATAIRTRALPLNSFSEALAFDGSDLWVTNAFSSTVTRVRPY